jgi:hypothetical protein
VKRMRVARKAQAANFAANVVPFGRSRLPGTRATMRLPGSPIARKVATANGGRWRLVQVRQILHRAMSEKIARETERDALRTDL